MRSTSQTDHNSSQYLMWMKTNNILSSHYRFSIKNSSNYYSSSREELLWPSKSYICSFCNKISRSAQALGGHMNVHRKDRARLKQSLNSQNVEAVAHFQSQSKSTSTAVEPQTSSPAAKWLKSEAVRLSSNSNLKRSDTKGNGKEDSFIFVDDEECVETSLSISISKRQKSSSIVSSVPVVCYQPYASTDKYNFRTEVLKLKTKSMEDHIDLELRLGDTSVVK